MGFGIIVFVMNEVVVAYTSTLYNHQVEPLCLLLLFIENLF